MKRYVWMIATACLLTLRVSALPPAFLDDDEENDEYEHVGMSTTQANYNTLGASMAAWGIGLAVVISALAIIISPSESGSDSGGGSSSHSH